MKCPKCGRATSASEVRCSSCGALLSGDGQQRTLEPPDPKGDSFPSDIEPSLTPTVPPDELETSAVPPHRAGSRPAGGGVTLGEGQAFGNRYTIVRMLGRGGMGAVYEAWDKDLGVPVALKVIRPEAIGSSGTADHLEQRFKRELLLARQVTHRNVVRIHDLGEVEGVKYISMPRVRGDNLAAVLNKEGKLPVGRALGVARQIAAGLGAAHDAGVIHRDLKPANIMIDDEGQALIMDFGIARSASRRVVDYPTRGATLTRQHAGTGHDTTEPGAIVGTMAYMAPEQAQALQVDRRADIYAFGLIFYDMLLGRHRFKAYADTGEELEHRLRSAPESPRDVDPEIPEPVDQIIQRCVQPDAEARYESVTELEIDLARLDDEGQLLPDPWRIGRWQAAAGLGVVVALLGVTWWFAPGAGELVQPDPMTVLIADFENTTGDAVFDDTLEQALTLALEDASFIDTYRRQDARGVAAQLGTAEGVLDESAARLVSAREGISVVLAGAIEPRGSGYRVSVAAIDPLVPEAEPLAEESANARTKADVLGVMGDVAGEIREALGDTTPDSVRLAAAETFSASSLEAIQQYSRAQELAHARLSEEAIPYYELAVEADPEFGRAYSGWATALFNAGRQEAAAELWTTALSLMDRMTERERLRTLGTYYLGVEGDYRTAIDNYSSLVAQYPADFIGHNNLGFAYFFVRDFAGAQQSARLASELRPNHPVLCNNAALYAVYAGDFESAVTQADRCIELAPDLHLNYVPLAMRAVVGADDDGVRDAYARMASTDAQGAAQATVGLADNALYHGRSDEAEAVLTAGLADEEQAAIQAPTHAMRIAIAQIYEVRGEDTLAAATAGTALEAGRTLPNLVSAARLFTRLGQYAEAEAIAAELGEQLPATSRAYGLVIEAAVARQQDRTLDAVDRLRDALALDDLWLARFDLGRVYAERENYAQALTELQACLSRRGEATALYFDDVPSYRYMAPVFYWLARAQQGLGNIETARENYQTYVDLRGDADVADRLIDDARRRLAAL